VNVSFISVFVCVCVRVCVCACVRAPASMPVYVYVGVPKKNTSMCFRSNLFNHPFIDIFLIAFEAYKDTITFPG